MNGATAGKPELQTPPLGRDRISSIDIVRGLVIVLMALDHTRDYFHANAFAMDPLDPAQTTPILYATRWISHFCAPTFVFLAGVSAWLQLGRARSKGSLSRLLLTRGAWLIFLELTIINFGWSFSFSMPLLQVIWAIGWAMIALSGLIWLPQRAVLLIGVIIVAGHNLLDPISLEQMGSASDIWMMLHGVGVLFAGETALALVAYAILPWIGVMAVGYGAGALFGPDRDGRVLIVIGMALIGLFLVLRLVNQYGDPSPWVPQAESFRTAMSFMNVSKYPPSLAFLCATLGPLLVLMPFVDRFRGGVAEILRTYGSVPLFAYVIHLYLIHSFSLVANAMLGRDVAFQFGLMRNIVFFPERLAGSGFGLWAAYAAWIAVLLALFPLCRWWAGLKQRHSGWWWRYL